MRTVPLVCKTSGSVVVDSSFIVTCTIYRRDQNHLFLEASGSIVDDLLLIVKCTMY